MNVRIGFDGRHGGVISLVDRHSGHSFLAQAQPEIELRVDERVIPIIEGILTDAGYVEEAVNIPNKALIKAVAEAINKERRNENWASGCANDWIKAGQPPAPAKIKIAASGNKSKGNSTNNRIDTGTSEPVWRFLTGGPAFMDSSLAALSVSKPLR